MNYRRYGRSGEIVSEIGLGGHREGVETRDGIERTARFFKPAQERASVVGRAIDCGVTYFDTTYGVEIASLGDSLRLLGKRDGLFVSGMRVDFFANLLKDDLNVRAYTRREVEGRIKDFGFDYIDQFIMGAIEFGDPLSHPASIIEDVFDELHKLRDEGKLRYVGFSCHEPDYAAKFLARHPCFDAVMVPYNFANRTAEGDLAKMLKDTGAALIAMKTMAWRVYGIAACAVRNLRPVPGVLEHDPELPVGRLSLQFVLDNPMVSTCVPAANAAEMIDENCSASGRGAMTPDESQAMQVYAHICAEENSIKLAIGGLFEANGRALAMSIGHLARVLGLDVERIDWEADDAEARAQRIAAEIVARLRNDPKWAPLLP